MFNILQIRRVYKNMPTRRVVKLINLSWYSQVHEADPESEEMGGQGFAPKMFGIFRLI